MKNKKEKIATKKSQVKKLKGKANSEKKPIAKTVVKKAKSSKSTEKKSEKKLAVKKVTSKVSPKNPVSKKTESKAAARKVASNKTANKLTVKKTSRKAPVKKATSKNTVNKSVIKKATPKKSTSKQDVKKPTVKATKKSLLKKPVSKVSTGKILERSILSSNPVIDKDLKKTNQKKSNKKIIVGKGSKNKNVKKSSNIGVIEEEISKNNKKLIKTPIKKYHGDNILKIYLVIKVAIFNHDIFGAYSKKTEAVEVANKLSFDEIDGNHTFDVIEVPLNSLKEIYYNDYYGQSCNQITLFSSSKKLDAPENEPMLWGWKAKR